LKGLSSSTKFFVIGITTLARMVIVNMLTCLHNLQDFNDETLDLVRSFFLHSFIYVFCCNEIVNNMETLFQALLPCLQLLCHYSNFSHSCFFPLWWNQWWMEQTAYVHYLLTRELNKLKLWTLHRIHKVFIIKV
jgi:hypothetical protein